MSNREPFWWPMNEPPLPGPYPADEVGEEWELLHLVDSVRNEYRFALGTFAATMEVDPSVTEHAANQSRLAQTLRRVAQAADTAAESLRKWGNQ